MVVEGPLPGGVTGSMPTIPSVAAVDAEDGHGFELFEGGVVGDGSPPGYTTAVVGEEEPGQAQGDRGEGLPSLPSLPLFKGRSPSAVSAVSVDGEIPGASGAGTPAVVALQATQAARKRAASASLTQSLITGFVRYPPTVTTAAQRRAGKATRKRRNSVLEKIMAEAPVSPVVTGADSGSAEVVDFDSAVVTPPPLPTVLEMGATAAKTAAVIDSLDDLMAAPTSSSTNALGPMFGDDVAFSLFDATDDALYMNPDFFRVPEVMEAVQSSISNTAHNLYLKRLNLRAFDPTTDNFATATPEAIGLMTESAYSAMRSSATTMAEQLTMTALREAGMEAASEILMRMPDVPIVKSAAEVFHMRDVVLAHMPMKSFADMIMDLPKDDDRKLCRKYRREAKNRLNAWVHNTNRTAHIQSLRDGLKTVYAALEKTTARYTQLAASMSVDAPLDYNPVKLETAITKVLASKHGKLPKANEQRKRETRIRASRQESGFSPISPAFC
jgi:hypothetical protein